MNAIYISQLAPIWFLTGCILVLMFFFSAQAIASASKDHRQVVRQVIPVAHLPAIFSVYSSQSSASIRLDSIAFTKEVSK